MTKTDLVGCLVRRNCCKASQTEKFLLEVKILTRICHELSEIFQSRYMDYLSLIKSNSDKEDNMYSTKIIQEVVKDILSTGEYTLAGIANHTRIPIEVLSDLVGGINTNPTFELSRKLFELHIMVRRALYDEIMKKIVSEYLDPM